MIRRLLLTGVCGSALAVSSCDSKPAKPVEVRVAQEGDERPEPEATPERRAATEPEAPQNKEAPRPEATTTTAEFRFADDAEGRALAELLTPPATAAKSPDAEERSKPLERTLPEYVADPSRMATLNGLPPARLPNPPAGAVLPRPLPDRPPHDLGGLSLPSPGPIRLPDGALTRVEGSGELSRPAPLPVLGKPVPDRAPLEDPTVDFTAKSVTLETIPLRSELDVNSKINLPDPFELRETIRFRGEVKETPESMPISQNVPKADKK
jgi:hypothetical protein